MTRTTTSTTKSNERTQQQLIYVGCAAAAIATGLVLYYRYTSAIRKEASEGGDGSNKTRTNKATPSTPTSASSQKSETSTPVVNNKSDSTTTAGGSEVSESKLLHTKIEELDKKGKALFKDKQYMEAAQAFTAALDMIDEQQQQAADGGGGASSTDSTSSLFKQTITLMNNRSAMYEKGGVPELALEDCISILDRDMNHAKARTRKLRILETLKRWHEALVEVCAVQLLFMQAHRRQMQMGLPVPPPPIPQSKMEELLSEVLPEQVEKYVAALAEKRKSVTAAGGGGGGDSEAVSFFLPSSYTILQLLRSYSEYNAWMSVAAKDGSVTNISKSLPSDKATTTPEGKATRASVLLKRGRRHVYDGHYDKATEDFEAAYAMISGGSGSAVAAVDDSVVNAMEDGDYARLLEWLAMCRHWKHELDSAMALYQKCADLEPMNHLILVKQAGVQVDSGKHEAALKLFDTALGLDPASSDALLHRSNLLLLQGKADEARKDLERCLQLRPNHVMSRLRLASILAAQNDTAGAQAQVDAAEQQEPRSSEVQSYRGELLFTQGKMDEAREQFQKAMKTEPNNPTPYVNAALALLNTPPPPGQMPDAPAVMRLLEQAIEVDPQFTTAYVQLGQLKLGTATTLDAARQVVLLYDQGLANCRSAEEIKELCSMRELAVAQVEAASMLNMETFNLQ